MAQKPNCGEFCYGHFTGCTEGHGRRSITTGKWPSGSAEEELAGTDLAGGLRCVLYILKGDLEYFANHYHLRHYNAENMCDFCPAHRNTADPGLLFNNLSSTSRWQSLLFTGPQWLRLRDQQAPHPVFLNIGINQFSVEPDELHIIYLGTLQYLLGSILHVLVYTIMPNSPEHNLNVVWGEINKSYKDNKVGCQYGNMSLSTFVDARSPHKNYPKLRGKGAESRDLTASLLDAWVALAPDAYPDKPIISGMLQNQLAIQEVLSDHKREMFLPLPAIKRLRSSIDKLLIAYQRMAASADSEGKVIWNFPTKWYWLWHVWWSGSVPEPSQSCHHDQRGFRWENQGYSPFVRRWD